LDIGWSGSIPAHIRRAVILRDRHCAWPRCERPAAWCDVHHIVHKADGGETSVENCALLCQLCRRRHNWHYADLLVMPMLGFPALVAGAAVLSGSA
jgi:5-methylcytosine-specific restriction endonuclease McrA